MLLIKIIFMHNNKLYLKSLVYESTHLIQTQTSGVENVIFTMCALFNVISFRNIIKILCIHIT